MGARHRVDARHQRNRISLDDSAHLGWDDLVPSAADESSTTDSDSLSHDLELEVQRRLLNEPGLNFSSLVIRRLEDGVCIQGVLEAAEMPNLTSLVRQVKGVTRVIDQVVVHQVVLPGDTSLC